VQVLPRGAAAAAATLTGTAASDDGISSADEVGQANNEKQRSPNTLYSTLLL
jgi:hypothetical protein